MIEIVLKRKNGELVKARWTQLSQTTVRSSGMKI